MSAPRRPSDIGHGTPLSVLAGSYEDHLWSLACHRRGVGDPLPDDARDEHVLAALAYQAALVDRAVAGRWPNVAEALSYGIDPETVAAATGVDADQLRIGLAMWAAEQHRLGLLSDARREAALALIDEATVGRGSCPDCGREGPHDPIPGKPGRVECRHGGCGASWDLDEPASAGGVS